MSRQLPAGFVEMLRSYGRDELTAALLAALADSEPSVPHSISQVRPCHG